MSRSIIELDRGLRPGKPSKRPAPGPSRAAPRARRPEAAEPPSKALARMLAAAPKGFVARHGRRPGGRRPHAFEAVNVRMKGTIDRLRQADPKTCWATVYTMMLSWKDQRSTTVENAIAGVGARWSALLAQGTVRGMKRDEKVDFIADTGLVAVPPQNPTIQGWAEMLDKFGPIWVTTDENPTDLFSIHARILCAVRGDGTHEGTKVDFIDPLTGKVVVENFGDFLVKFESEAATPGRPLRIQIVHWPAGARTFSLARRSRASSVPPPLFVGTARAALLATLVERGVPQADANGLIEAFAAEVRAEGQRPVPMGWRPSAFDTPNVPHPGTGDPRDTAREILAFFYPDVPIASVTEDHIRLATLLFHEALETQKWLNRLYDVPKVRPSPRWLLKQIAKILWREVSGPKGISVAARNKLAANWRTTLEEIQNGLSPAGLPPVQTATDPTALADAAVPDDAETRDIARSVLLFFYPAVTFDGIGPDHVRLATAMFYAALRTQPWLEKHHQVPRTQPMPDWLASPLAKQLWPKVSGKDGVSAGNRAQIANDWREVLDRIQAGEPPSALGLEPRGRAFDIPDVPSPGDGDPHETAHEILAFFYPGRNLTSITDNHVRLAAAMFYAAVEKQKWLNRLPENPGKRPGLGWLAKQAVKILWREMSGVSGFSVGVRNSVALQWRHKLDQIENGLEPEGLSYVPRAFDTPDVPRPDEGDPRETAREILCFFYPGRSFDSISDDHVRLAAAMFYAALAKQKVLNLLPDNPGWKPKISWLAKQAVKIVWRQMSGPKGFTQAVRNTVALQWRTTLEEIENGLPPTALGLARSLSYAEQQGLLDWIRNPDIPLSPAVGGMSLSWDALQEGDLILSTTTDPSSQAIRRTGAPVSHAMLYVGGGQVVEAVADGVVYRPLEEALRHSYVGVAFRHPGLTREQALIVRDHVGRKIGAKYDYGLIVAHAKFQLGRMVCDSLPAEHRDACLARVGPVDIGQGNDDKFICSSLVAEAFEAAGAPLLAVPAQSVAPGDLAQAATLVYLGHVKYDPPAGIADRIGRM